MPEPADEVEVPEKMVAWFAKRGIRRETIDESGIYWGEWIGYDKETGEITNRRTGVAFPLVRDGRLVSVKYRFANKGFALTQGAELMPWGMDGAAGSEVVYLVEGEIDALTVQQVTGSRAVLSPPNGSSVCDDVAEKMVKACEKATRIVLAGDMDEAGQKMIDGMAQRLGKVRCWRVTWPDGCKDANDTLMEHGEEAVAACLQSARPYPVQGIVSVTDLYELIDELYDHGMPGGESTGWASLDQYYTVRKRQLSIVTGAPGSGKSVWLNALMLNLAEAGWKFAVCSPEQVPLERHSAWLIQGKVGLPFADGPTPRMTKEIMHEARAWVADRFWFVLPEENTIDAVLERSLAIVVRHGIDGLVIDPWNNFDHSRPNGMTETEYVHMWLTKLRYFDLNHDVHIWLAAHPTKLRRSEKDGKFPVATPYDISGSAGFFNKADNCISVYRHKEDDSKPVEIHVQKIRFSEDGGLGMAELRYDKVTGRYSDVSRPVPTYGKPMAMPRYDDVGKVETFPGLELYGD
ncbi:MAG: toprim domain-containing protein [Thermomicrobiales bacterium]|nr:toprim domain-containing protein [Thermomicrobiales bacterium]